MDKYVGKKLDGRYEIRELIGIGGMANVYRCYDTVDDREVAIKILKDEYLNNEDFIRRFKNESKAIAVLSHPNIVKVYDVSFGDMIQYIVMEYIDGITLKEYINQQGTLSWKETVHLITQILMALSHAHSKGVVHRDIKPQNMMLLSDGTIKVTDFGIARFSNSTRTMTEQAIGSVHYIAPEQAKGDITDGKTDIYSVGVMMYEMLTGKLPFDGDNAVSVALMHLQLIPENPRTLNASIPEGIEEITLKAMQKQPMDRYQSAQDMLSDIERFKMNPSVRFEYKYFNDKQHVKYSDAVSRGKISRAEEFAKESKPQSEEKVRHSIAFPIIIGILIAAFITTVFCITYSLIKSNTSEDVLDVEVPNFIGMSYEEAMTNKGKFELEVSYEHYPDKEMDVIVEQEPTPGSKNIKENKTIKITINKVQSETDIPTNIVGTTVQEAKNELTKKGFSPNNIVVVEIFDPTATVGSIVACYPAEGCVTKTLDNIYLYVASEKKTELIEVPDVIGETDEDAEKILEEEGFRVRIVKREDIATKGEVISQAPLGGALKSKAEVTIYVSKGAVYDFPLQNLFYVSDEEYENGGLEIMVVETEKTYVHTLDYYEEGYSVELSNTSDVKIYYNGVLAYTIKGSSARDVYPKPEPEPTDAPTTTPAPTELVDTTELVA